MKNLIFAAAMSCMVCACGQQAADTGNPFLSEFETPYGTPDFDRIKVEHYEPAFLKGIEQQNGEIKAIVENPEEPSFENTIVALDNSGEILARVSGVFFALTEADTNDEMMALEAKIAPMLSEHSDNIFLNQELYKRVAAVHAQEEAGKIQLTTEQHYLLDKYYKEFVRSGAGLDAQKQERLREINKQLSTLTIEFGNHVLADNNDYLLVVDKKEDLAGLPDAVIAGAAQEAKAHGKDGKWVFTLQESSRTPLLQYAQNRELRKNIYQAYTSLGNRGNANDNKEVLKKVLALRLEKAQLMGFNNFAEYQLADNMAKNPKNALDLLYGLWEYSIKNAKAEAAELQKIMDREGKGEKLEAWDWWYYAEKLRQEKYDLNEDAIKPYFSQEDVHNGLCTVVNKLYGITLTPCDSISVYNKDVKTYIVKDADDSLLGVFYSDYMPRASKRSGALQRAEDHRHQRRRHPDHQRNAPADRYAHQQIAPGGVGSEVVAGGHIRGIGHHAPVGIEVGERRYHRREGNEQRNKHQHNQAGHRGAVMHKATTRILPEATPLHFQLLTEVFQRLAIFLT